MGHRPRLIIEKILDLNSSGPFHKRPKIDSSPLVYIATRDLQTNRVCRFARKSGSFVGPLEYRRSPSNRMRVLRMHTCPLGGLEIAAGANTQKHTALSLQRRCNGSKLQSKIKQGARGGEAEGGGSSGGCTPSSSDNPSVRPTRTHSLSQTRRHTPDVRVH